MPGHIPPDVDSEEEEGDFGPPDLHDVGDDEGDGGGAASSSRTTDPLERFIQEHDDLASKISCVLWTGIFDLQTER